MIFEQTRKALKKLGLPEGDAFDMPSSTKRFPDGAAFRIECPTVNSAETVAALLDTATKTGVTINRITETFGMFRHTAAEIKQYCKLCNEYGCELLLSTGPRATYDTGATVLSPQGVRVSYRLRGQEQLIRAIEDVKRGYELGCRGFLIYDEGMLWVAAPTVSTRSAICRSRCTQPCARRSTRRLMSTPTILRDPAVLSVCMRLPRSSV